MKNAILILFVGISTLVYAQVDTLFTTNGEILSVNVTEITESNIKFQYPGESFNNSIGKNSVSKVHFSSGRKEHYAQALNVMRTKGCLDWKNVQISNIDAEVIGLSKIDNIGAKAKGNTAYASISKLQDRAYNKIKIETAMKGGNVAYLIEQNTEESIYGGKYGSSKMPSVTISGLAYTSKKVSAHEIEEGEYTVSKIYQLKANAYDLNEVQSSPEIFNLNKEQLAEQNGFQQVQFASSSVPKVNEYTVIYSSESELILSAEYSSKKGKKTYYNIFLEKAAGNNYANVSE